MCLCFNPRPIFHQLVKAPFNGSPVLYPGRAPSRRRPGSAATPRCGAAPGEARCPRPGERRSALCAIRRELYIHKCKKLHTKMCVCMYVYIHTYLHAYMHTCIQTYIHSYRRKCMHVCMHACMNERMRACRYVYICIYRNICYPPHRSMDFRLLGKGGLRVFSNYLIQNAVSMKIHCSGC